MWQGVPTGPESLPTVQGLSRIFSLSVQKVLSLFRFDAYRNIILFVVSPLCVSYKVQSLTDSNDG